MDSSNGLTQARAQLAMVVAAAGGLGLWWIASSNYGEVTFGARLATGVAFFVGASLMGLRALGTPGQSVAGEAWLMLAAFAQMAVGATLAQAFDLGGSGWELWAAWAAGTGAMAWVARSGALGLLAAVAVVGTACTLPFGWGWTIAWAFGLGLLPLAYHADSRLLLHVALVGTALAVLGLAGSGTTWHAMFAAVTLGWIAWDTWHHAHLPFHAVRRAWHARDPRPFDDDVGPFVDVPLWAAAFAATGLLLATTIELPQVYEALADTSGPGLATMGTALVVAIGGWLWAYGRLARRGLHLAVGLAAVTTISIASGAAGGRASRASGSGPRCWWPSWCWWTKMRASSSARRAS